MNVNGTHTFTSLSICREPLSFFVWSIENFTLFNQLWTFWRIICLWITTFTKISPSITNGRFIINWHYPTTERASPIINLFRAISSESCPCLSKIWQNNFINSKPNVVTNSARIAAQYPVISLEEVHLTYLSKAY